MDREEKLSPSAEVCQDSAAVRELVLYNDQEHTFHYVIGMLIEVCHHEPHQAEQCVLICHLKGSCVVKTAPEAVLKVMCNRLKDGGLSCEIK